VKEWSSQPCQQSISFEGYLVHKISLYFVNVKGEQSPLQRDASPASGGESELQTATHQEGKRRSPQQKYKNILTYNMKPSTAMKVTYDRDTLIRLKERSQNSKVFHHIQVPMWFIQKILAIRHCKLQSEEATSNLFQEPNQESTVKLQTIAE
jgi:hypothetical protein